MSPLCACAPSRRQTNVSQLTKAFVGAKCGGQAFKITVQQARRHPVALFQYQDFEGNHVLHHCARRNSLADMRLLMKSAVLPRLESFDLCNTINRDGHTALHLAVLSGNAAMVQFLLECGISPAVHDTWGMNCLHEACMVSNLPGAIMIVNVLLTWDPQLVSSVSDSGQTPLSLAVHRSEITLVRTILRHVIASLKHTPLLSEEAASPSHYSSPPSIVILSPDMVSEITSLRELLRQPTVQKLTVFHIAAVRRATSVLKLLLDVSGETEFTYSAAGYLPLHYACANGDVDTIMVLHSAVPDALASAEHSRTAGALTYPLHLAAASDSYVAVKFVLLQGGSFACNIQDYALCTPLHYAARRGNSSIVSLLLHFGSDPKIPDAAEKTALDYCSASNFHACLAAMRAYERKLILSPWDSTTADESPDVTQATDIRLPDRNDARISSHCKQSY